MAPHHLSELLLILHLLQVKRRMFIDSVFPKCFILLSDCVLSLCLNKHSAPCCLQTMCLLSQGVTAVQTLNAPFRRSAKFSTPIGEKLDDIDPAFVWPPRRLDSINLTNKQTLNSINHSGFFFWCMDFLPEKRFCSFLVFGFPKIIIYHICQHRVQLWSARRRIPAGGAWCRPQPVNNSLKAEEARSLDLCLSLWRTRLFFLSIFWC